MPRSRMWRGPLPDERRRRIRRNKHDNDIDSDQGEQTLCRRQRLIRVICAPPRTRAKGLPHEGMALDHLTTVSPSALHHHRRRIINLAVRHGGNNCTFVRPNDRIRQPFIREQEPSPCLDPCPRHVPGGRPLRHSSLVYRENPRTQRPWNLNSDLSKVFPGGKSTAFCSSP